MPSEEQDTIAHLLKVEEEAAELIRQAQEQCDKEIAEARAQADADYSKKYEAMAAKKEGEYNQNVVQIDQSHKKQLEEYKSQIQGTQKDVESFNALLEKIL